MIDYTKINPIDFNLGEITAGQSPEDLRLMVNEMIDTQLELIAECVDADVTFVPVDKAADDPDAASDGEKDMAWTLGHVIVHCCASSEESTFLASEMARGVPNHGRSRFETHWTTVKTVQQCREALEESRRMRLATLNVWPSTPDLEISQEVWPGGPVANAMGRFVLGHVHELSHFGQIRDIVGQAHATRTRIV